MLETAEGQLHVTHHGSIGKQPRKKKKKKKTLAHSLFRRGLGVVIRTYFLAKLSLYQTYHLSAVTPVFSTCSEEMSKTG